MDYGADPRNLAISPSYLGFPPQYDARGRPIQVQHPYTYNQQPLEPPGSAPLRSSPSDENHGGISIRGRANRGRSKGRSHKRRNPNLIDRPRQAGPVIRTEYDSNKPGLVLDDASVNVNDIPISNARNRLRDRLRSPTPQPSIAPEESHEDTPGLGNVEPEPNAGPAPEIESPPEQHPLFKLLQQMAANGAPPTPTGPAATHGHAPPRTRRLANHVQIADAYMFQQTIDDRLRKVGVTSAREDALRLAGVQWIDQTRKALKLPVRTFDTACVYYHKFRLVHGDNEYAYVDASAAALFTACKIEDTLKKSRDILCAAHNAKAPSRSDHLSPDDSSFDAPSRAIVGTERLMLESSGFDFRSRHPQTVLVKLLKSAGHERGSEVANNAWNISIDLYRTLAPLKMSTAAMAFACMELAERLGSSWAEAKQQDIERKYKRWSVRREMVVETLLDLLDVYTSYRTSTALGPTLPLDAFINVRIPLNEESARRRLPRYTEYVESERPRRADDGGYGRGTHNGHLANGGNSGRSSKNTSPKDVSPGSLSVPGTGGSGSTAATAASTHNQPAAGGAAGQGQNIRQRAGDRGREGTVRFMLNPERDREERAAIAEYGGRG